METLRRNLPDHLRFLVWVHLILLAIFSIFRGITLVRNRPTYLFPQGDSFSISTWEAFQIGFRFDVLVASYALLLPYLLLTVAFLRGWTNPRWFAAARVYCTAIITLSLVICAIDVEYFAFFNSRLSSVAVDFRNLGQVIWFIINDIRYYPVILVSLLGIWGIGKLVRRIWTKTTTDFSHDTLRRWFSSAVAFTLMLLGLFGGAMPQVPDMKPAVFSTDGFLNQLALNPVHTWVDSFFDFDLAGVSLREARRRVKNTFGGASETPGQSPIARSHDFDGTPHKQNVVLILMESMSAHRMGQRVFGDYGDPRNITPGLDSLATSPGTVLFDQCFSNGIHTYAGLYSSIYGMPIRMMERPMNNGYAELADFTGLPVTLREHGYETIFFCTHPKTFDNLDFFLSKNGFNQISDLADYPDSLIANTWGVGDETLFEHAHERLNQLAADTFGGNPRPFFATILTITAHPPYTMPAFTKFKSRHPEDPVLACYEYADWALKNFMHAVAREPWYENTVFVLVGDHGTNIPGPYDVPLSYNHVPLIVHAPGIFSRPQVRHDIANQTDIFPTVMGLLRLDYAQNTMGFDLFREKRPFAVFSQDMKMGVIDDKYLYIARKSGRETLYEYKTNFGKNILGDDLPEHQLLADSMRDFGFTQLQVANWMIQKNLTRPVQ